MVEFPTTIWTTILRARERSQEDLERFCARYRPPVRAFLKARGCSDADAEDLAQQVFLRIIEEGLLKKADQERGRFRSLILGIAKNVWREVRRHDRAQKRGGGRTGSLDGISEMISRDERDDGFDRLWLTHLVELAMDRMKSEGGANEQIYARALRLQARGGAYESIAAELGKPVTDVRNYLHRGKEKLKLYLAEEIRRTSSSGTEYQTEIRYLSGFLKS